MNEIRESILMASFRVDGTKDFLIASQAITRFTEMSAYQEQSMKSVTLNIRGQKVVVTDLGDDLHQESSVSVKGYHVYGTCDFQTAMKAIEALEAWEDFMGVVVDSRIVTVNERELRVVKEGTEESKNVA